MTEWETCFDGCTCPNCRQRRSDYFFMINFDEDDTFFDLTENRLINAMKNLDYNNAEKQAILKKYRR